MQVDLRSDIRPNSYYQNFEEDLYDRDEDTIEEVTICKECQGEVRDGKCMYGCDDNNLKPEIMKNEAEKAYSEILKLLKQYKNVCIFDVADLERKSKWHLFGIQLKEEFGFDIDPKRINSLEWIDLGEHTKIGLWGEMYHRTISWSDNGEQPNNELLLNIKFPTGAYIFGGDYPTNFFQEFFNELKTYNPKYIDSTNHGLYFSMDNAGKIFNEFNSILKKYYDLNQEDFKKRKIEKLKDELKKLEL